MIVTMLVLLLQAFEEPRHRSILRLSLSTKFDMLPFLNSTVTMIVHDDRLATRTRGDQILRLRKERSLDEDRPNIQEIHTSALLSHLLLSYLQRSRRSRHTLQSHLCRRPEKSRVEPELKTTILEKKLLLLSRDHKLSQAIQEIEVGSVGVG